MASVQIREYVKDDRNFVVRCDSVRQRTVSSLDDMGICKLRNGYGSRMANLILAEIRSGRAAIYIAEINQVRVGMVSAAVHTPSIAEVIENGNMKIGVVTELFVEPDSRRKAGKETHKECRAFPERNWMQDIVNTRHFGE